MIKVWKLLSISIVAGVILGLMLVPAVPNALAVPTPEWGFEIQPAMNTKGFNETFTVDAEIVHYADDSASYVMYVLFNGTLLDVNDVVFPATLPNGQPPFMTSKTWDNTAGWVKAEYAITPGYADINVSFTFCTINFSTGSVPGVTNLNFVWIDAIKATEVQWWGVDYLNWDKVVNGTVIIGPAFNLTVTSNGCCPITVGGLGTVGPGNSTLFTVPCPSVILTAGDSACCVFNNWTGNVSTADNPTTVTGSEGENLTATATCSVPVYNLTMAVSGSGTTTPSGSSTRSCGEVVAINAIPTFGWQFINWTTADISEIDNPNANSTTVTMDEDKTVTANFAQLYTLTMAVTGSGTTVPAVGAHAYDNGTVVDITATPAAGWHFVNWTTADMSEIANPTAASTNVTVDENKTVTATFAINVYNLTINSTTGGSVDTPGEGTFSPYNHGDVQDLIAIPDADYAFVGWSGDVGTIADVNSSTTNITMTGNYSIMAHFGPHDFSASPISLTFTTDEGENPPSQTLEICNTGDGTLDWSLTDNAAWLTASPTSGSLAEDECEDVTVSVNVAGMKAGDYSATITITGSPEQEVPVSLHIESAMPDMLVLPAGLSASALSISPQQVQPGQDVTISINVANTGGATGSYNAVLYINSVVEDSQSVSVAAGTSKNVIFTVSKSQAGVYDVSLAGQSGQFEVVGGGGWFGGGGLGTGGIIAIVVIVIILIVAVVFIVRGTTKPE